MKEIYFITATNTDVGKTYASEVFLKKLASKGKKVGYLKPIETGVDNFPLDGTKLFNLTKELNPNFDVTIDDVVPIQLKLPAAPYVASDKKEININMIKEKIDYLLNFCDTLIIEGAGGLMVPINLNYFIIDLIKDINPTKTILISPSNLGSINDTLLSQKMLEQYEIKYDWYINLYKDKDSFDEITLPFYKAYFDKIQFL
jgi:dethiobiotin synthetase